MDMPDKELGSFGKKTTWLIGVGDVSLLFLVFFFLWLLF
jgi:hypothetical protein